MMVAFVRGRFRYDLVAAEAFLATLAAGIVKPDDAFAGFQTRSSSSSHRALREDRTIKAWAQTTR
jgi:di/tricarboxylate transporter